MLEEEIYKKMEEIARGNGVELTENAHKIAKARIMMKCPLTLCICDPKDAERGCISKKCMDEIKEKGMCHCRCYCIKDKNVV